MIDFKNGAFLKLRKTNKTPGDVEELLINGESAISSYITARDYVVFTNKRIIAVNVQGLTGAKKDYTSIPYSKIQTFSIETAGMFDTDGELEIYISSIGKVKFEFNGLCDIKAIGRIIAEYAMR